MVYIGSFRRAFDHHCVDKVLGTKGGDLGSALHGRMVLRAVLPSHLMTENPSLVRVWRIWPGGCWEKKKGSCQKHLKLSERRQKHLKSSKVVCFEATIATSLGSFKCFWLVLTSHQCLRNAGAYNWGLCQEHGGGAETWCSQPSTGGDLAPKTAEQKSWNVIKVLADEGTVKMMGVSL